MNLSGTSLGDRGLLSEIEALVAHSGLPPGALTFEITETAAIADIAGLQRWARRLKELGCGFALDDFGTGFSSFAYLQALPVDLVKIDGSFVRDLDTNPTNRALVGAMVAVAHALGKTVVAEMVETRRGGRDPPRARRRVRSGLVLGEARAGGTELTRGRASVSDPGSRGPCAGDRGGGPASSGGRGLRRARRRDSR